VSDGEWIQLSLKSSFLLACLENVLIEIRPDGTFNCVICDFGFATVVPPEANIHNYLKNKKQKGLVPDEKTQVVRGLHRPNNAGLTAAYASPEVGSQSQRLILQLI
jgi:serine/threonine protein kinase